MVEIIIIIIMMKILFYFISYDKGKIGGYIYMTVRSISISDVSRDIINYDKLKTRVKKGRKV